LPSVGIKGTDEKYPGNPNTEVQDDLRRIAGDIDTVPAVPHHQFIEMMAAMKDKPLPWQGGYLDTHEGRECPWTEGRNREQWCDGRDCYLVVFVPRKEANDSTD